LGPEGRAARRRAAALIPARQADPKLHEDAIERFAQAVQLVVDVRAEWDRLGRPFLAEGGSSGKVEVAHPKVRMISDAERDAERCGAAVGLEVKVPAGGQRGAMRSDDRKAALTALPSPVDLAKLRRRGEVRRKPRKLRYWFEGATF